ncbi:hypothetical protein Rhe02_29890 [Rhizocola hellebori]|uniref:FAD/NAD(P)-binding domain-containing protein n=1 Tax=Rhizocola hellebori TaxID=1392758 RepID=A0A8J3Q7Q6_9ACTN|nr:FAD-dependent oxidoreductase [Rhizocola hellebori]GIH04922.1 hypothetical protein Rhe02_29890 [Rhizocola hellebori]
MGRRVVIVGGGYGGSALAKALVAEADVTLIDPREAFINTAGSLRALTQPDWARNMFFPYPDWLPQGTVIRDRAVSVDPGGVTLASGRRVEADYLVLATGSSYTYPAKPNADNTDAVLDDLRLTHKELADANRVLILGAGPVGLELAGEVKEVWPEKHVTVIDPAGELLPGFRAELREDLHRQLDDLGIRVRLDTGLKSPPSTPPGRAGTFTVTTAGGEDITADIWFRAYGGQINGDYLDDGRLTSLTQKGVCVNENLNVVGYHHVYALGDITDLGEAKMAGYAMQHAEVIAKNIVAQLNGEEPSATYRPAPDPMILLPLGPSGGVGQLPTPDGPIVVPAATVSEYKGADLFTAHFARIFSADAEPQ